MIEKPMTLTERQAKHRAKKKQDERECEQLKSDVSAAVKIIDGALAGLRTVAVDGVNQRVLLAAANHIEAAMMLLEGNSK